MELGVFSLTDINPGSPDTAASRIDDIIRYGILAEQIRPGGVRDR